MRPAPMLWIGLIVWVFCGCAGYRLGPTGGAVAGARSIQVNLFQNKTMEPRLVESVASALRKSLQQDGTYRLNTHRDGDIVVNGVITHYERSGLSFQPNDVLTVRDYSVRMVVKITAIDRHSGKTILDREIEGGTVVRAGADLASGERQAVPLLANDFAKNATSLLVEGTW